jgi:hypothetical protein
MAKALDKGQVALAAFRRDELRGSTEYTHTDGVTSQWWPGLLAELVAPDSRLREL